MLYNFASKVNSELGTVMSIYRLHILKYTAGSPIRRHFFRKKFIFKMSIGIPYSPHKLFRFVRRRFEEKSPKIDVILGSAKEWQNGCGGFISGQNFIKLTLSALGLCTNHVDRIQGIFDPPLPLVDEHRHLADPPLKPRRHFKYPPLSFLRNNFSLQKLRLFSNLQSHK